MATINKHYKTPDGAMNYIGKLFNSMYLLKRHVVTDIKLSSRYRFMFRGKYILVGFLFVKLLCLLNFILLLFILQVMIQETSLWFGWKLLKNFIRGIQWEHSGSFPRLTWCDMTQGIREDIKLARIQCVLPANSVYEKIVITIWFWFVLGLLMMGYSGIYWLNFLISVKRCTYFENHIVMCMLTKNSGVKSGSDECSEKLSIAHSDHQPKIAEFKHRYLQLDGMLILKLIETNFGEIDMQEILWTLWMQFDTLYQHYL